MKHIDPIQPNPGTADHTRRKAPPDVFRAGEQGLTVLAYGTREPNDICFYPRSGKVFLRGVGVIGRIEQLDYWDGEELE